jgi:hypothetical protein
MNRRRIRPLLLFIVLIAIVAWLARPNRSSAQADNQGGTRLAFGSPILLEGSNCVLMPCGDAGSFIPGTMTIGPAFFLNDAISGHVGSPTPLAPPLSFGSCFDAGQIHWNNVIVYHSDSHDSLLLLNRKAIITRFYIPRPEPDHLPKYLVFAIADPDNDGVVKENGPVTLYVSDPEGRELEAVTPPNTRVEGVTFDSGGATLYVQIATDNGSPSKVLRVDPLHPVLGAQLWSDDLQQQALRLVAP